MSTINNRFLLNNQLQKSIIVKKEDNKNTDNQTTSSEETANPSSEVAPIPTSVTSLDNDLLVTYRGINIDVIKSAETKSTVVSNVSGVLQNTNGTNSGESIAQKYLVDETLAKTVFEELSKSIKGANIYSGSQNSILNIVSSYAKGNLNKLYSLIKENLSEKIGDDFDEETINKIATEAIEKTIKIFTDNKTEKQQLCSKANSTDKGFVISPIAKSGTYSSQRAGAYNLQTLSNTFIDALNEGIKANAQTFEENYEAKKAEENEQTGFNPANYTIESSNAANKALGTSYSNAKITTIQGNENNISLRLNQYAYKDLEKVAQELIKELKEKNGKNFNEEIVENVIEKAISQTIVSFDDNEVKLNSLKKLNANDNYFLVTTNTSGKVISGSYNVKALVDSFIENFNKQISTSTEEELSEKTTTNKYQISYLSGRYGLSSNVIDLYFDKGVEASGNFIYTIKDEYKDLKLTEIKNNCYQKVVKSLIIQNFLNGTIDSSTSDGILKTTNGTVLNINNFQMFMDEIKLYADNSKTYSQTYAIQKFQTEYAKGNLTFSQAGAIANALGAENIKNTRDTNNYKISFTFQGHDYEILCTKKAGKSGADNETVTLYTESELKQYNASQEIIDKCFYKAISVDGSVSRYALYDGITMETVQTEIKAEQIQNTYDTYNERFAKAFANEEEFASVFEDAKTSAMEEIKENNITESKGILFTFDKALSTSINNALWAQYEKESAQTASTPKILTYSRTAAASTSSASSKKNSSSAVGISKTIAAKDGGTITINYQGVFVNGMLVTDPSKGKVNCNITFTDKSGNTSAIPLSIGLDLLPEPNKKLLEALKNDINYKYSNDPTYYLNSHPEYQECDLYTQEQWFEKLIANITNSLSGLTEEAINALKMKQPTLVIEDVENNPYPDADVLGTYDGTTNQLGLYTKIDKYSNSGDFDKTAFKPYVILHEIGHLQDYTDSESSSSKLFANLEEWANFKSMLPENLQGAYALTNIKEFFAEYFAYKNSTSGMDISGTTGLLSIKTFQYLDNQLKNNPNSELSAIYKKVKNNAENIRKNLPITNNDTGVTNGKKYTNEELINKIKDDWTNDKINIRDDVGESWSDIAETFGLNMQTKDILAEYYKYKYLNEPSDIITKLENATGNTKYGDSIKKLWEDIKKTTQSGSGLNDACENFDKKIKAAENANPMVSNNSDTEQEKPSLYVHGSIQAQTVTGFTRTGDGLFLQSDGKGSYTSEFYENAVNAAILKYGEGLNLIFTVKSDGTISYTISDNGTEKTTNYVVIDATSNKYLKGSIDHSNSQNLSAYDKLSYEAAQKQPYEEMLKQNFYSAINLDNESDLLPTKLTPIEIDHGDVESIIANYFLEYATIYKDNNDYYAFGDSAGAAYLAVVYSLNETGSLDSAIDAMNKMATKSNGGGGIVDDRSDNLLFGYALLSDTFASFNAIIASKQGLSMYETEQAALACAAYVKNLKECLTGVGGGGSYGKNPFNEDFAKKISGIFEQYNDPKERMIAIINLTGYSSTWDTRVNAFAKQLQEELEQERKIAHGGFNSQNTGSSVIDNNYSDLNPPTIIIEEQNDPFNDNNSNNENEDPFKKTDHNPIVKF